MLAEGSKHWEIYHCWRLLIRWYWSVSHSIPPLNSYHCPHSTVVISDGASQHHVCHTVLYNIAPPNPAQPIPSPAQPNWGQGGHYYRIPLYSLPCYHKLCHPHISYSSAKSSPIEFSLSPAYGQGRVFKSRRMYVCLCVCMSVCMFVPRTVCPLFSCL